MRLRQRIRLAGLVIVIVALMPSAALGASQTVAIRTFAFAPPSTTIVAGESITWHNFDPVAHTATSDTGAFDTLSIAPGATSKTVPFANAGTYAYHCSIHPTMKATITVQGATATPAPPPPTPAPTAPPTPPPTPAPTDAPTSAPSPSPTPSASASPTPTPTPPPSGAPTRVSLASVSPTTAAAPGPTLGSGPGALVAALVVGLAAALAGLAIYLYRRR